MLTPVTTTLPQTPFAVHPDGTALASVREDGLWWVPLDGRAAYRLSERHPTALSWNPSGERLALVTVANNSSSLQVITLTGEVVATEELSGFASDLIWRNVHEILLLTQKLTRYSFGGNLEMSLQVWHENQPLQRESIHSVTLKKSTLALGERLFTVPSLQLSPWGDEILFERIHDPPQFPVYQRMVVRHLDSGEERALEATPLLSPPARYSADGEAILYADGDGKLLSLSLWPQGKMPELLFEPEVLARQLTLNADGSRGWRDGALWQGKTRLWSWSEVEAVKYAAGSFWFRAGKKIFRLEGDREATLSPLAALDEGQRNKLLLLRRWRSNGLITPADYNIRFEEILR
ncbi:MAG: hypothetical protein C0621_03815 [Desulfuromonas sp.]|nr:MAG: hypothetical protein C0621_03815 [Desulfuromonas sp.]